MSGTHPIHTLDDLTQIGDLRSPGLQYQQTIEWWNNHTTVEKLAKTTRHFPSTHSQWINVKDWFDEIIVRTIKFKGLLWIVHSSNSRTIQKQESLAVQQST
jgi:hypothetical protein